MTNKYRYIINIVVSLISKQKLNIHPIQYSNRAKNYFYFQIEQTFLFSVYKSVPTHRLLCSFLFYFLENCNYFRYDTVFSSSSSYGGIVSPITLECNIRNSLWVNVFLVYVCFFFNFQTHKRIQCEQCCSSFNNRISTRSLNNTVYTMSISSHARFICKNLCFF